MRAKMWLTKSAFPALSWDQALPSFSWVNRFQAGKQAMQYPRQIEMLRILNTNRENNERNGEEVFNFEDLCKLQLKSIVLSSTHSFRTLAFLVATLLLSRTSMLRYLASAPWKKLTIHIPWMLVGRTQRNLKNRSTVEQIEKNLGIWLRKCRWPSQD